MQSCGPVEVSHGKIRVRRLTLNPGYDYAAIHTLGKLTMADDQYISEPEGGWFSSSLKSVTVDGNKAYNGSVVICRPVFYGLEVDGVEVTSANCKKQGYDPETRTLTLEEMTLYGKGSRMDSFGLINRGVDGLKIRLVGENTNLAYTVGIISYKSLSLVGNGSMSFSNPYGHNISLLNIATLTIDGPSISLNDGLFGDEKTGALIVKGNSRIEGKGGIGDLRTFTLLDGQTIIKPEGAYFDSEAGYLTADGTSLYRGEYLIAKPMKYGMFIGETAVTSVNAADILGNGQFSYDATTKTLTVTDATLENNGSLGSGISNHEIEGLTIHLVGHSTIQTRMAVIGLQKTTTITGTGTLDGTSAKGYALYLTGDAMTCTIDGPTLNLKAKTYGIDCYRDNITLAIEGISTRLTLQPGNWFEGINNLGNLLLAENLKITSPKGGYFSPELKSITTDGEEAYMGTIVIEETGDAPTVGDVNGDGSVDVADIGTVIDIMAGATVPDSFPTGAADVNGDSIVDVADIAAIIDIMAGH